jgi:hypothetical protein
MHRDVANTVSGFSMGIGLIVLLADTLGEAGKEGKGAGGEA